jgi:hypothetical protein
MQLLELRNAGRPFFLVALLCGSLGCGEDASRPPPDDEINIGFDGEMVGCAQPTFPGSEPDLSALQPPLFVLTNSRSQQSTVGQAIARPGEALEAEVWVNGATRQLKVELANAWAQDSVVYATEEETSGFETVDVTLFTDPTNRGRYFMKLTLCGADCDEQAVVFDLHPCSEDPNSTDPCGVNAPYDRTVIEDGEIVRRDETCIDLGSTPGVGSGTVLIQ